VRGEENHPLFLEMDMTAWVLLVTIGANVFAISGIATEVDCNTLAASVGQATSQSIEASCVSYQQASAISEVHVFGPNRPPPAGAPPKFEFHKGAKK
jgi:hypothetical protein